MQKLPILFIDGPHNFVIDTANDFELLSLKIYFSNFNFGIYIFPII